MEMNQNLVKKIDEFIAANRQNIIDDIFKLVRVRSVSVAQDGPKPFGEGCAEALDLALEMGKGFGLTPKNYDYYIGSLQVGDKEDDIAAICHIDIVPEGNDWKNDPFNPIIKDGYLIGRGVCDDKGPAVAVMYAMKFIKDMGLDLKYNIKLLLGCNEECGMKDVEHYLKVAKAPVFAMTPDAGYPVCNGEKGIMSLNIKVPMGDGAVVEAGGGLVSNMVADRAYAVLSNKKAADFAHLPADKFMVEDTDKGVKITAIGISAHASMPKGSLNAIYALFQMLLEENALQGSQKQAAQTVVEMLSDYNGEGLGIPLSDEPSGKITHVCGVFALNGDSLDMNFNIRYPVTADSDAMVADLKAKVAAYGCTIASYEIDPPCYTPADSAEIQFLIDLYNKEAGKDSKPYIMGGGTYSRKFPHAVAFGAEMDEEGNPMPAGCGGPHEPDECMGIESLMFTVKMYTIALIGLNDIL